MSNAKLKIKKRVNPSRVYRRIVIFFITILILLILAILYLSLVKATVIVYSKIQNQEIDYALTVDYGDPMAESKDDLILGEFLTTELDGEKIGFSTGKTKIATDTLGIVKIINQSNHSQQLVERTRLLTEDGFLIRIKKSVTVPAIGEVKVDTYYEDADYKDNPTKLAELKEKGIMPTKFVLPALRAETQKQIFAVSEQKLSQDPKEVLSITAEDIENAKNNLAEQLLQNSQIVFQNNSQYKGSDLVYLIDKEVLKSSVNASVGDTIDQFEVYVKIKALAVVVDKKRMYQITSDKLAEKLAEDQKLVKINSNSFKYSLEKVDLIAKKAVVRTQLSATSSLKSDTNLLNVNRLAGLKKVEVIDYLQGLSSISAVEIRTFPFWLNRLPSQTDHIDLIIY